MTNLHFSKLGAGNPLIILHGLYGSGSNWHSIGKALGNRYAVYMPDLRNHGQSFHNPELNYAVLSLDLEEFMSSLQIEKAILVGHSMGGKIAMKFALENPGRVQQLTIIDIALRSYAEEFQKNPSMQRALHQKIVDALGSLDLDFAETREEVDRQLARNIPQKAIRQFLLKNLRRNDNGKLYLGLNVNAIHENLAFLLGDVRTPGKSYGGPALVVSGKKSGYILDSDHDDFRKVFPQVQMEELDSGHWVHAEQPHALLTLLLKYLP